MIDRRDRGIFSAVPVSELPVSDAPSRAVRALPDFQSPRGDGQPRHAGAEEGNLPVAGSAWVAHPVTVPETLSFSGHCCQPFGSEPCGPPMTDRR